MEEAVGKKAVLAMYPMQAGDVKVTYADTEKLIKAIDYKPSTKIKDGISEFIKWYTKYYKK
jgi:UDP-glucuronate 4-epimerase